MKRISTLLFIMAFSGGCSLIQRHETSGYGGEDYGFSERGPASLDTFRGEQVLSAEERKNLETQKELESLERNISSDGDRRLYYRIKPLLSNDEERIEFLQLPDRRARERWLKTIVSNYAPTYGSRNIASAVASAVRDGDIMTGMPKQAVLEAWGDPEDRMIAGNPEREDEKWIYTDYVDSTSGYQKETRIIYFENGHVAGWETR